MTKGKLFRIANLYLVMAGLLSGALLFAPLAYASNFTMRVHASIYGTWVVMDKDMGSGVDFVSTRYLLQVPLHWPYAVLGATLCLGLIVIAFFNRDDFRKLKRARRMLWLGGLHVLAGALLRVFALQYVGTDTASHNLEAGFQREFLLHFFVLYFIWRALGKIVPTSGLLWSREDRVV